MNLPLVANLAHYAKPLILKRTEAFLNDDYPGASINITRASLSPSLKAQFCIVLVRIR